MAAKTENRTTRRGDLLWLLLILIIILIGWLVSQNAVSSGHRQILGDQTLPPNAQPCEKGSGFSTGYTFSCPVEVPGYTMDVASVPDGVTPYLLPISDEERDDFLSVPSDGFDCPIKIAGNLVFADNDSSSLVTLFKAPVELTLGYDPDQVNTEDCPVDPNSQQAVLIPVYLYSYPEGDFRVWKPFQSYSSEAGTITVRFQTWGDPPVGTTPLRAPVDWGPP